MSAAESEPTFEPRVVETVDAFVESDGVEAVEEALQARYGAANVDHGRQQEALAYLRYTYGDEL